MHTHTHISGLSDNFKNKLSTLFDIIILKMFGGGIKLLKFKNCVSNLCIIIPFVNTLVEFFFLFSFNRDTF